MSVSQCFFAAVLALVKRVQGEKRVEAQEWEIFAYEERVGGGLGGVATAQGDETGHQDQGDGIVLVIHGVEAALSRACRAGALGCGARLSHL